MSDRIRLLWWSDTYWPRIGGIEVLASHLVPGLAERGFEIVVVTSHHDDSLPDVETHDGIEIRRFHFHEALRENRRDLWGEVIAGVGQLKANLNPEIVHLNFPSPSAIFHLLTGRSRSVPLVVSIHTAFPANSQNGDTLVHRILNASAFVAANSRAMLHDAVAIDGSIAEKSGVIYNGVPDSGLDPSPLPFDPPVIACIARLVEKKGIDVAVNAFAILRQRIPHSRMLVAGDGPEMGELRSLVNELGVGDSVEFRGWVEPGEIARMMNEATVLVVPSRTTEPFGIVAVEAMQMARPVICTDRGGLPEVVVNEETGIVVPAGDAPALAEAAIRLLEDKGLAERMGHAGKLRARELFSMTRCIDEHAAMYRTIAASTAGAM